MPGLHLGCEGADPGDWIDDIPGRERCVWAPGDRSRGPDAPLNPVLVVEVLSESSKAYDRGAKAAHYRRIASLREYVLTSQSEPLVEVYRKNAEGRFELFEARADESVELASVGVSLAVRTLYANPLER